MNRQAMIELRRVVENCPDDLLQMVNLENKEECGTHHCAFGWAMQDPWFLKNTGIGEANDGSMFRIAGEIFDLSKKQASALFGGKLSNHLHKHRVSKDEVLANIDRILDGLEPLHYPAVNLGPFGPRILHDLLLNIHYENFRRQIGVSQ